MSSHDAPPAYDASVSGSTTFRLPVLEELRGKRVILASASPRRKELLAQIGLTHVEIVPSGFAENFDKTSFGALEYCVETASRKVMDVYESLADQENAPALVIAADTILLSKNAIIEKPKSEKDHIAMLRHLRDIRNHKVITAVAVIAPLEIPMHPGFALKTTVEETNVTFGSQEIVTDEFIEAYVASGEGSDAAGGYKIQEKGALLIERIDGDYSNVVGLPLQPLLRLIKEALHPYQDDLIDEY